MFEVLQQFEDAGVEVAWVDPSIPIRALFLPSSPSWTPGGQARELLRLLIDEIVYDDVGRMTIKTILPLGRLHPASREGERVSRGGGGGGVRSDVMPNTSGRFWNIHIPLNP